MANRSKARGTRTENEHLDKYVRVAWPNAERSAPAGINDQGDFINTGSHIVESKYRKTTKGWRVAQWMDTLIKKAFAGGGKIPVLLMSADKRRKDGFAHDLVVMRAPDWLSYHLVFRVLRDKNKQLTAEVKELRRELLK